MCDAKVTSMDTSDGMPRDSYRITWLNSCHTVLTGFFFMVDFGFDIYLAIKFHKCYTREDNNSSHRRYNYHRQRPEVNVPCTQADADDAFIYFILTLMFMILPSFVMTVQSFIGYDRDVQNKVHPEISVSRWISLSICHVLQLAPIWRCAETLILGQRLSKEAKRNVLSKGERDELEKHYHRAHYRLSSLKLAEAFLEGCPQLVLQAYILIKAHGQKYEIIINCFKIGISLLSVATSMMNYHEKKRWDESHRRVLHGPGIALQFFWYLFTLLSRLVTLAVLALFSIKAFVTVVTIHWLFMFLWIQYDKHKSNIEDNVLHNIAIGGLYVFNFVKELNQPLKWHYVIYYFIVFDEGLITMVVWYIPHTTRSIVLLSIFCGSFVLGIFSMIFHYKRHPSVMHGINPLRIVLQPDPLSSLV